MGVLALLEFPSEISAPPFSKFNCLNFGTAISKNFEREPKSAKTPILHTTYIKISYYWLKKRK